MALTNSGRQLLKATYAPVEFDQPPDKLSQAHVKAALVRGLQLQAGEVDAVRSKVTVSGPPIPDPVWSLLKQFEPQPVAALIPKASTLADIAAEHLQIFAQATLDNRTEQLRSLDQPSPPPSPEPSPSPSPEPSPSPSPEPSPSPSPEPSPSPPPQPPVPPDPAGGPPLPRLRAQALGRLQRGLPAAQRTAQLASSVVSVVSGTNVITSPTEMAIATAP